MKNLTPRKIVLGLLTVLVLAFSVQGNLADALSFGDTRTNDLQTILRGSDFSVTFAVTLVDEARKSAYTAYTSEYTDTNGVVYVYEDKDGSGDYNSGDRRATKSSAFHYNNEAVRINVSGAGAKITSIGNNTITPSTSITVKEGGSGAEALTAGDIVVNCSTSSYGEVTITASDATPAEDYPSGVRKAPNFFLTTYVTQYNQAVGTTRTIRLVGVTNGVAIGYDDQRDQPIYNGDSSHYPVTYTAAGGGMLRIQEGSREGTEAASLSTSSAAKVLLSMEGVTNTVTAQLGGSFETSQGIYIFGNPQLSITNNSNNQSGAPNATLTNALRVTLQDNASSPAGVVGVPIKFDVTDKSPSGGLLSPDTDATNGTTIVDASNEVVDSPIPGSTLYVRTGTDGVANIDFQLGTIPGEQTVNVSALGIARLTKTIKATATGTPATRQLFAEDIDRQGTTNIYTLVARVENGGTGDPGEAVTFTTTKGLLTSGSTTAKTVTATTNAAGKARVTYNAGDSSGTLEVVASISVVAQNITTQLQEVTFNVRGGSSRDNQQSTAPRNVISISASSTTGEPGAAITVNVTSDPSGRFVTINSGELNDDDFSVLSSVTPFQSTLTLPDATGEYDFSASSAGLTTATRTVTVETGILGTLSITRVGAPSNGTQLFTITVRDTDGARISSALTVRLSGSGFATRSVETLNGVGDARLTLPTTAGTYTLTASANNYTSGTTAVRIAAPGDTTSPTIPTIPTTTDTTTSTTTVSEPESIEITGPPTRSGTVNEALEAALIVRVLDADEEGVEDARVTFRVRTGQGRLQERGSGRAIAARTNAEGYARADYTPMSVRSTVEAEARGVTQTVTFTITTDSSAPAATPGTSTGTRGTLSTSIAPKVLVGAANRPPMAWVDGGSLYALVGKDVQKFAPSVGNALNIAIGGNKIYWTEKTGESAGTINSANLDGTGIKELKSIQAVPMGIAVDTAGSKLYWTNSRGRIQSANLDGSGIQNVLQNLSTPMDIALAGGNAYWTQANGNVRFVNLKGTKNVRNISTGTDPAGSLAIAGGKVYWTEITGESAGTVNSANLNGSGAKQLASIRAVPMGIAVDGSRSKLYWTNSRGRVQSANLNGSKIQNVVDGLGMPGDMVLSNSLKASVATTKDTPKSTTTASNKYDINGDGTIDSTDTGLIVLAISTGDTAKKYDVNGDGTVNFSDYILVSENITDGAAAAPTLLGVKMTAEQVARLQEQIDLLIASGDRSPAALRALIYFQQLIATARPEKTQLLANYPNPFNPETWIPYELATDTEVRITIYNAQGVVIRTLQLGQQSAGYYTDRERSAYWDGRNALGEQVASGIYFYQLETDDLSSLRKMVILK